MRRILAEKIEHGSFQAAETEVVARFVKHAAWESNSTRVTGLGEPVNFGAAGITELQKLGNFVERFTGSVVHGLADDCVLADACHVRENRVTTGNNQRNHRQADAVQRRRIEMRFEVIDSDEWLTGGERDAFAGVQADEQRRGETGAVGRGDGVNFADGNAGFVERGTDNGINEFKVPARGEFRYDAAVGPVQLDL